MQWGGDNPVWKKRVEAEKGGGDVEDFGLSSDITDIEKEINMEACASTGSAKTEVSVSPFAMTFEDFVCGFTSDSSELFSVDPTEGRMGRTGDPPTHFNVTFDPQGRSGEFKATLCIVFPDDKPMSQYYNFTVKAF